MPNEENRIEFFGKGILVSILETLWGKSAWIRFRKPKRDPIPIKFRLVTGGKYNTVVFEQDAVLSAQYEQGQGSLIKLPSSIDWEMLERLYVVVTKSKEN